jgi:hypothetical protein
MRFRNTVLRISDINEGEKTDRFVRGLKPHLQREIRVRGYVTLEEIIVAAERLDAVFFMTRPSLSSLKKPFREFESKNDEVVPMELGALKSSGANGKLSQEERTKLMKEGACFFCKEKGHRANSCPKKKKGNVSRQ